MPLAGPVEQLVDLLARLPGIGRRTARRLVFYLLDADPDYCSSLGKTIASLRERVRPCSVCGNVTEVDPCSICREPSREKHRICVVTSAADLLAVDGAGTFRGHYHVLGGVLAPLDGVGPEELRIDSLLRRVDQGGIIEVILATPPSVEGEATATYLAEMLKTKVERITRIASGVPHGGELDSFDPVTLGRALDGRREMGS